MPEIGREDDPEDQLENRGLERPARGERHVHVDQVAHPQVGRGEDRKDHEQDDVHCADHQRRGDGGVQRPASQVVQADGEQHGDPRRSPDGRGVCQRGRHADVENRQDQQAQQEEARGQDQ